MSIPSTGEGRKGGRYADTRRTAAYIGSSPDFLEKARITGTPKIPYIKLGRRVIYDLDAVDQFMAASVRFTTSGAAA